MTKAKPIFKVLPGYYDPADYVLVHKDWLKELQKRAGIFDALQAAGHDGTAPALDERDPDHH